MAGRPREYARLEDLDALRADLMGRLSAAPGPLPTPPVVRSSIPPAPAVGAPEPRFEEWFLQALTSMMMAEGRSAAGADMLADNISGLASVWIAYMFVRGVSYDDIFAFYDHTNELAARASEWSEMRTKRSYRKISGGVDLAALKKVAAEASGEALAWDEAKDPWQQNLSESAPAAPAESGEEAS